MQPLIRNHSYLNHSPCRGGGGGGGDQNLEHLVKVVFLCWSFLEVYIFATTCRKAFIVGPKVPYQTLPHPTPPYPYYPTLPLLTHTPPNLAYPTPFHPTQPKPCPTPTPPHPTLPLPYPYPTLLSSPPLPYLTLPYPTIPYPNPTLLPYPTLPTPTLPNTTLPLPYPLRIQTHAHNQTSRSRATLSCDSS